MALIYSIYIDPAMDCRDLWEELHHRYVPTLKAGWTLWPAAHAINFAFVPSQHRILYTNVVSVLGTYVLSKAASGHIAHLPEKKRRGKKMLESEEEYLPNEVLFDGVNVKLD